MDNKNDWKGRQEEEKRADDVCKSFECAVQGACQPVCAHNAVNPLPQCNDGHIVKCQHPPHPVHFLKKRIGNGDAARIQNDYV